MIAGRNDQSLDDRVVGIARREFPTLELGTALWLLRECRSDDERISALIRADGDLTTLVLAVEEHTMLTTPGGVRTG